ncbi:hypothetical protein BG262_04490 [Floricoccus penangensis]|uniref:Major facilitator superfamily (MFS) profile domain-containing protein n=1 Tax=Floricoccus penangensis TaxID=1859475 RepID=A0A9Q5NZ57_9LACT|nr:MFS transporter [Floricoccus penangensis]OFI46279.1 hypothetical protein BG262_04490 [Floricoccus penangensis]
MNNQKQYKKNIPLIIAANFVSFFGVTTFFVAYLSSRGMSVVEIGILESIFHVTSLLSEIPSGALADRFSYKSNLIIGRLMQILSAILMIAGHSFWVFALGMILSSWAYNFDSGTNGAFLYESSVGAGLKGKFLRITSLENAAIEISLALGQVVAALFIKGLLVYTYYISILLSLVAIGIYLSTKDIEKKDDNEEKLTFKKIISTVGIEFKEKPYILIWMFFQNFLGMALSMFYFYYQLKFPSMNKGLVVGIMVLGTILNALFSIFSAKIGEKISAIKIMRYVSIISSIILLGAITDNNIIYIFIYLSLNALYALTMPAYNNELNLVLQNETRATMISVSSMMFSLSMAIFFPLVGYVIKKLEFPLAFTGLGILILIFIMVSYRYMTKVDDKLTADMCEMN